MTKPVLWSDLVPSIPVDAMQDLEQFLFFSELRTGAPARAEQRLLETLAMSVQRRRRVS